MSLTEKDFLMRQILMLSRFLGQVLFSRKIADQEQIVFYDHASAQRNEGLSAELKDLIDLGKIDEAENRLFEVFEREPSEGNFASAVSFYQSLMHWDEAVLKEKNFSREEIGSGFHDICRIYGVESDSV